MSETELDRLKRIESLLNGIPEAMQSAGADMGLAMVLPAQLQYWYEHVQRALAVAKGEA